MTRAFTSAAGSPRGGGQIKTEACPRHPLAGAEAPAPARARFTFTALLGGPAADGRGGRRRRRAADARPTALGERRGLHTTSDPAAHVPAASRALPCFVARRRLPVTVALRSRVARARIGGGRLNLSFSTGLAGAEPSVRLWGGGINLARVCSCLVARLASWVVC